MTSATNGRVALCTRLAMAHNGFFAHIRSSSTAHTTWRCGLHSGCEFEVIQLDEECVPVRVFAHMLVHYINHGCSHLHHPFKDNPVHRAMQWNSNPPGYEGGVRLGQPHSNATHIWHLHASDVLLRCPSWEEASAPPNGAPWGSAAEAPDGPPQPPLRHHKDRRRHNPSSVAGRA